MALISLQEVSIAFGGPTILDKLDLQLESGQRVALIGRNGAGKTTLMKIISNQLNPDSGKVICQKGIQVSYLAQEVASDIQGTVFDVVLSGLGKQAKLLMEYHHVSHQLHSEHTPALMRQLDRLQTEIDHTGGWDLNAQVEYVITKMKLDADLDFKNLSGGQKRRVLLARALVLKPDVLLLDEPTNHLDIESIGWLENFIKDYPGTIFFVTHDRMFMSNVATRIVELDRGKILSWSCDYKTFLERKEMALEVENAQKELFEKKLAQEEVWIRQGVKARRCRNEGRVKVLQQMRNQKRLQRRDTGEVKINMQETEISGRLVVKITQVGFNYDDKCLIRNLTTQIMRGDKIGIIGPNGSGKTTLLRVLLGKLAPTKGTVKLGTNLEIIYYDQLREQLEEDKTVMENVNSGNETVTINGKARHIISYLQDFLFTADRARTPVKVLSGGERNRLLLARLFTKPSNFLVMDEPTNDLDIETLELLEELLIEYSGTLLLVSHDRAFLNNVVTSTMVLEGDGAVNEYPGGYDDWLNQRKELINIQENKKENKKEEVKQKISSGVKKLSYKDARELELLPAKIEKLEKEIEELGVLLADVSFYRKDPSVIAQTKARVEDLNKELKTTYLRWEELEKLKNEV